MRAGLIVVIVGLTGLGCATTAEVLPEDPRERGKVLLERGSVRQAVEAFELDVQAHPQDAVAHRWLAMAYTRKGDYGRARQAWGVALEANPADGDGWRRLGDITFALGQYQAARQAYRKALALKVSDLRLVVRLAEAEIELEEPELALRLLDQNQVRHPQSAAIHIARGRALNALHQPDKAVVAFRKAAELDDKDPTPWVEIGMIYEHLDFPSRAAKAYQQVIALQPEQVDVLTRLGRVLIQSGEVVDALPVLTRAVRLQPDSVAAHNNLGVAYSAVGLYDEAVDVLNRGLRVDPKQPTLHSNVAEAYYKQANLAKAEDHLRKAVELAPDRPLTAAALKRVVLMRVIVAARCRAGALPAASVLKQELTVRWQEEGWPAPSFEEELQAVLSDGEAMLLLEKASGRCEGAPAAVNP